MIRKRALLLRGLPVGITFNDGTGMSGVLCRVGTKNLFVLVFEDNSFILERISISSIKKIRKFPRCPLPVRSNG